MSEIKDINADQLDGFIEEGNLVMLLIWVKRCDQCAKFKPVFNRLHEHYPEATLLRMNMYETMENLRRAEQYEESITPIIPVFCNGDHLGTFVGYYSFEDFTSKLDEEIEKNC